MDLDTAPQFLQAVRAERAPAVILDLSNVDYLDSGGVGALVQTYSSFRKAQRRLALAAPRPRIVAVLELTCLLGLFQVYPNVAEAESHLA